LNITQLIKSRRSIRKFKPIKVPRDIILTIMDSARWAPSAHNAQPWRFIVIDDEKVKGRLATEMGKTWLSDMYKQVHGPAEAEGRIFNGCSKRRSVYPKLVACCSSPWAWSMLDLCTSLL